MICGDVIVAKMRAFNGHRIRHKHLAHMVFTLCKYTCKPLLRQTFLVTAKLVNIN